jgi:3-hydroxybutyryl-CoA dehydrogenase
MHAKIPVLLHDRSKDQIAKGLALVDKLLAKDVGKGRLTDLQAKETRERISVVSSLDGFRDVDMVVEVRVLCIP